MATQRWKAPYDPEPTIPEDYDPRDTTRAVAEVARLVAEGETFLDASCMVISWFTVHHLDEERGDEALGMAYDIDLQGVVQRLIRAVFGGTVH